MTTLATHRDSWLASAQRIADDRESGATAIAADCCRVILSYLAAQPSGSVSEFQNDFRKLASVVLSGQPTMAPVVRVVNAALLAADSESVIEEAASQVQNVCQEWLEALETGQERIATNGVSLLPRQGRVVTISHSSDVRRLLLKAYETGCELHVTVLESRPAMEGRGLAAILAEHGIPTELVVDAAAHIVMQDADLWLAGADSLTLNGTINKVGTALLGLSGQFYSVPGRIVCNTGKIWPSALGSPPMLLQDAAEVWENPPTGVNIINRYFDLTPWMCINTIVTEQGIYSPAQITSYSNKLIIHPTMKSILEE